MIWNSLTQVSSRQRLPNARIIQATGASSLLAFGLTAANALTIDISKEPSYYNNVNGSVVTFKSPEDALSAHEAQLNNNNAPGIHRDLYGIHPYTPSGTVNGIPWAFSWDYTFYEPNSPPRTGETGLISTNPYCPADALGDAWGHWAPQEYVDGHWNTNYSCILKISVPDQNPPFCSRSYEPFAQGNPIDPSSASKFQIESDFEDSSPGDLSFSRTFRSRREPEFKYINTRIGQWRHRFQIELTWISNTIVIFTPGDGKPVIFWRPFMNSAYQPWTSASSGFSFNDLSSGYIVKDIAENTYKFNDQSRIVSIEKPGIGVAWQYSYLGDQVQIADRFGRHISLSYADGKLVQANFPDGSKMVYKYNNNGNLISAKDSMDFERTYFYEDGRFPNFLTGVAQNGVRTSTFAYDSMGLAQSTEKADGIYKYEISYGVGTNEITASIKNPNSKYQHYSYSSRYGFPVITSAREPSFTDSSAISAQGVSATGFIVSERDFRGNQTTFSWNEARRLPLTETRASGQTVQAQTTTEWHPTLRLPLTITETGAQGGSRVTTYTYDERGNRLSETVSGTGLTSSTHRWSYTAQNLVSTETDEVGAVTRHSYDSAGNRTSTTDPLGRITTYTYDAAGRVLTQTEPNGVVTSHTYDLRGRLLTQTVGGLTTTMTYRPTGLLASVKQPSGYQINYTYDAAHRLTGWSDNRGNSGQYVLDGMGNRTSEQITAQGQVAYQLSRSINAINRVASETVGGNQTTSYTYDANGDLVSFKNGLSQTTSLTLDALRRQSAERNPLGASATLGYNSLDAVTTAKDFKGVTTTYTRDAQGHATQEASADIGTQQSSFDAAGQNASHADAVGRSQQITRDVLGRPTQIVVQDASASQSSALSYDSTSGQLKQIQEPQMNLGYQRDNLGRVTTKSITVGGQP